MDLAAGKDWRVILHYVNHLVDRSELDIAQAAIADAFRNDPNNYYLGLKYAEILLSNHLPKECLKVLNNLNVLPNEGATRGRNIYRRANLILAKQSYDQRGFDYITRDQMGYDWALEEVLFEESSARDNYQRLIFKAAANDNYSFQNGGAHMRDLYIHVLSERADLKLDERTGEYCIVYINGEYWGVYDVREKADDLDYTDFRYDQRRGFVDLRCNHKQDHSSFEPNRNRE